MDISNATSMQYTFQGCSSLTTIPLLNTSNVTNMYGAFSGCLNLKTIPALDVSSVTNATNMFSGCYALEEINMTGMSVSFSISASTQFTESALITILNNLATVQTTQTLTMGATNLAKLTQAEKDIATAKGWTLA